MKRLILSIKKNIRLTVQLVWAALTNGYVSGFVYGKIYTGRLKNICVPGLSCYSCPGALGSCPLGSLQATLGSREYKFAFYVIGFLMIIGAVFGRFVCGWLCPFGLIQDLLYKIPFITKLRKLPGDRFLKWLKYVILAVFVILLPLFAVDITGLGSPFFCKYICPSGTLTAGIPLVAANSALQAVVGWLYTWKVALLAVIVLLSVLVYRPFCKYLCPLGAVYGLFNPIAFYRIKIDADKCTKCGRCEKACPMNIKVYEKPNSAECIRCGICKKECPFGAIETGMKRNKKEGCESVDK